MQVHHDEGVANRIDPKSCADTREGIGEALTVRENITTRRYIPEVGAVCPNWARTDLCGLRLASALKSAVCDDGRGKA